ncbi:MAG: dephospho-CoA kinase [Chloroflexi bacterium]|nr:dephospho-CoA kinase [Chloroflexota bacterium]
MKVIGLTGGIGTGKSTVAGFLADLGAVVLDADKIGHEAFQPGTALREKVVTTFGQQVLAPDGTIDRKKLGEMVFGKPEALARLNQIMHPAMFEIAKAKIEDYRRLGVAVVVLEAPLLLEAGWTPLVDETWVTVAPEATVLKRLKGRTGLTEAESLARIRSQLATEERLRQADVVIDTDCTLDELKAKLSQLWAKLTRRP